MENFLEINNDRKLSLGIDEAGRGSVLGPLVIGAVIADEDILNDFNAKSITDSKLIKKKKRSELSNYIHKTAIKAITIFIDPPEIDLALKRESDNLNLLELRKMSKIVLENIVSDVYIDAISTPLYCTSELKLLLKKDSNSNITRISDDHLLIQRKLNNILYKTNLTAQNKADLNFMVVSAASVIAKTARDNAINEIEEKFALKKGILASGYANSQLFDFLNQNKKEIRKRQFNFIRYSWNWGPLQNIISKKGQKKLKL